ncbi:alpha/beta fold hydrolase [Pseudonocardia parietis]|uniref:Pimeloyl-ACP methyl ester carboxylesterase n=1 Tax=Pseudonocardia parietis TaxID=570936 RepID=A0ABS4VN82_9PSEU|nr:alpha/beta fold hydrolase [Pseudonocardia parietis]MBP2365385.1 pimeloyl-ACP methyl ester carboxylesterase [Pseudonocardia parietis]
MSGTEAELAEPTIGTEVGIAHDWAGSAAGPVTVVLHGGGPGCHAASDFAAVVARRPGRRWLRVDLPGYGGSPVTADPGLPRIAAAAHALAGLLEELGPGPVDMLAQSLGGTVALRLAAERPELVGRIVLVGSQPTPAPGGRTDLRTDPALGARARAEYYGGDGPDPAKMRALLSGLEWFDPSLLPKATVQARYRASTTATALAAATTPAPAEDLAPVLGAVAAPALVVWGRHDPFAGPDYAAALADTLPRGDLAVVGRTAHHPQAERPEIVAALADAFLADASLAEAFRTDRS